MTIREYLQGRVIHAYRVAFPFVVALLGCAIYWRKIMLVNAAVIFIVATYIGVYVVLMRRTPCPRCSTALGNTALNWGSRRQPAPRCPGCRISIDEKLGGSP